MEVPRDMPSFGNLRSVVWWVHSNVSVQPISLILKCQVAQSCLSLEDGADMLSRKVGKGLKSARDYNSALRKFPKECRCHLHRGGGLKSRKHHEYHATNNSSASETGNFCRAVFVALHPNNQLIAQHPSLGKPVRICSHKYACLFCLNDKIFKAFL